MTVKLNNFERYAKKRIESLSIKELKRGIIRLATDFENPVDELLFWFMDCLEKKTSDVYFLRFARVIDRIQDKVIRH